LHWPDAPAEHAVLELLNVHVDLGKHAKLRPSAAWRARPGSRLQRLRVAGDQVEHAPAAELAARGRRQVEHLAEHRVHEQRAQLVPCARQSPALP